MMLSPIQLYAVNNYIDLQRDTGRSYPVNLFIVSVITNIRIQ